MLKSKWSQLSTSDKITLVLGLVSIMVAIIGVLSSGFLSNETRNLFGLNHPTPTPTPTPSVTQSGPINLTPNGDSYGHKINSWSKPAYNGYCQLPDCDKSSVRVDILTEGTVVTATCWTYGQMVITGTPDNPGYKDIRWVRLEDGTYLPNTWFMRDRLSQQLPRC